MRLKSGIKRLTFNGNQTIGVVVDKEEEKELFGLINDYCHTSEYGPSKDFEATQDMIVEFVNKLIESRHCPRCSCE